MLLAQSMARDVTSTFDASKRHCARRAESRFGTNTLYADDSNPGGPAEVRDAVTSVKEGEQEIAHITGVALVIP